MNKTGKKVSDSSIGSDESSIEMVKEKAGVALASNDAQRVHSPKIVGNDSSVEVSNAEPRESLRRANTSPRNRARAEDDISHSDPYVALRIADTPRARRSSGLLGRNDPYTSLSFGDTRSATKRTVVANDPYVSLRIAPSNRFQSGASGEDAMHDSSGTEENASDSVGSRYEHGDDDEELSEFLGDADSEDIDKDFPDYSKVSSGERETEQGKDALKFSGYARVSVAGSDMEYGKDLDREFPAYARGSFGESDGDDVKDEDKEFTGNARISIAGSDTEYGRDTPTGHARVSVAGSEIEHGKYLDQEFAATAKVSVGGSELEYGKDVGREYFGYAQVSVAGSETEYEDRGLVRISIPGSETDHGKDGYHNGSEAYQGKDVYAKVSLTGSETDHVQDTYARLSVAGSVAEYGRGGDWDFSDYARVSIAGSEGDTGTDVCARVDTAKEELESEEEIESESEYGENLDMEFSQYARVSGADGEADPGNDAGRDVTGYARLTVMRSDADSAGMAAGSGVRSITQKFGQLFDEENAVNSSVQDKGDQESWNKVNQACMELSLLSKAKLQYHVRVVLISPLFEQKKRKLSAFSDLYKSKFGRGIEATGFSSVASLCYVVPDVVQRRGLEEKGELILVDSCENRRAVSGIRSGLRRIVYDALSSFCGDITLSQLEEKCSELLGKPLVAVLSEHGYDTPNLENLIKDMADIAGIVEVGLESHVCLCAEAEDPALTDGLLIRSTGTSMTSSDTQKSKGAISEVEDGLDTVEDSDESGGYLKFRPESLKIGGTLTLRSLKNELRRFGVDCHASMVSAEHEILQCRLRIRILLAFHNFGHGVEIRELPELYQKTFDRSLDLSELGFTTLMELARHWQDIFLLQELKPNWVFLVPSVANRRLLNALRTGLRPSVYSVLLQTYPEGLDPLDFLHRLQEVMSGELWEVLEATGYICSDGEKTSSILASTSADFQLANFDELCILLDDMIDFVQLGSNEDGSVVVKLRNGELPLVDLSHCNLEETDVNTFDELFVNLMMIAVDNTETSGVEDCSPERDVVIVGHVQSLVKSFEGIAGLRSVHSQTPDSLRLKHEIRLILGCAEYFESGLAWNELSAVYRNRTGHELGSKSKGKSLLRAMPDIVCKDSLGGDYACLSKTPHNLRVLSATRAGLRQALFWALLKNPGGVWANFLEGWFTDFTGLSLAATLQIHGYEMSKSRPFFPVQVFLRDMSDLLQKKPAPLEVYTWASEVTDPVHSDARLLGLSELEIQYHPLRWRSEKLPHQDVEKVREPVGNPTMKESEGGGGEEVVCDFVENSVLRDVEVETCLENNFAFKVTVTEERSDMESEGIHSGTVETLSKEGNEKWHPEFDPGDIGNVAVECSDGHLVDSEVSADNDVPLEPYSGGNAVGHVVEDDDNKLLAAESEIERVTMEEESEAYTQLRVTGKGPKVNLDEWQFTDSDEEDGDHSDNDEVNDDSDFQEGSSDYSEIDDTGKGQGKVLPEVPYVAPKVKEARKDTNRAWVLPNKIIPWK